VSNLYLAEKADLFKISNLVYDGKEILKSLYNSWEGTEREFRSCSKLAG